MRINPLDLVDYFAVSLPVAAMSLVVIAVAALRLEQLIWKKKRHQYRRRPSLFPSNASLGFAFLPLGIVYRPSLVEVVKAQIRQQEDADEDDNGDPDSPKKHLLRQLRRIRRGEKVDILSLRLE